MRIKIHYRVTLIFGLIIAVILCGFYAYFSNDLKDKAYESVRTRLKNETDLVKLFLEKGVIKTGLMAEFDYIADKIGLTLNLRVTIIDLKGVVLGDSDLEGDDLVEVENHMGRPEIEGALHTGQGESKRYSTTVKKEMLYNACLFGEAKPRGVIRLSKPLSEIEQLSWRLKKSLIISLVIAFILTIIISLNVFIFISKPLKRIANVVSNIAAGDFSKKLTILSNNEIGDIAKAFNYMREQIGIRIEEVTVSKLRFEAVLMSMFEGVMVVDITGGIILMNRTLKEMLHVEGQFLDKKPLEVMHHLEIQEIADNAMLRKQGVESLEISIFNKEEYILLVYATPVIRDDKVEGAVLVFHDITELRRLEKVRQDFVANVSHELRTPMTSIKGYTETLIDGALEDKNYGRKFLDIIYNESNRMIRLMDEILDLARVESDKLTLNLISCQVDNIIKSVISSFQNQADDKSIVIKTHIPESLPKVFAEEQKLSQILLNLLENAVKYTDEGGEVVVSCKGSGEFVLIEVADTGIGISERDQKRIFERFYRVDKARSRKLGGTGLGLSIVKHIVHAHHGEVFVKSAPRLGSTFSFTIPKFKMK